MTVALKKSRLTNLQAGCSGLEISAGADLLTEYGSDWTRFRHPDPAAVVFPRDAGQVCQLVKVAAANGIPLVPSGGRTGLSGGAVAAEGEVVVSFDRMRRIVGFDPVDRTLTVEAGVTTGTIQETAVENGLYYPISFAAEGSSQIGGNIATNAGGIRVLRYGLTRDRVAGLKVVDGRGDLLEVGSGLVKNASGYDLRHLMIGSEGTLGLVVEATLWLTEPPPGSRVMLLGVPDLHFVLDVLRLARRQLKLSAFEFLSDAALSLVCETRAVRRPLEDSSPYYALLEFDCVTGEEERVDAAVQDLFEECLQQGWVRGGVISQSESQAAELWCYREYIAESADAFVNYKNDVSVRLSKMPDYLAALDEMTGRLFPDFEVLWYGHIGDGNLHMNILKPEEIEEAAFEAICAELSREIYEVTSSLGGSVSAEHGIGLLKRSYLEYCRSAEEIERMRGIKAVFDPAGILNPGKLLA
jgi:FAD/FMN-containing dehydrogenase